MVQTQSSASINSHVRSELGLPRRQCDRHGCAPEARFLPLKSEPQETDTEMKLVVPLPAMIPREQCWTRVTFWTAN